MDSIYLQTQTMLDRIDLHVDMQAVSAADLVLPPLLRARLKLRRACMRRDVVKANGRKAAVCGPTLVLMETRSRLLPHRI